MAVEVTHASSQWEQLGGVHAKAAIALMYMYAAIHVWFVKWPKKF